MKSSELLQDLIERTRQVINHAEQLNTLSADDLNKKTDTNSWSILECFEHLNRYSDFYIPEIRNRIHASKHKPLSNFKSNWLGNYFAKGMLPKEKLNKMKTFKSMNPIGSDLNIQVIEKFISDQHVMLNLLDKAKQVNLKKTKTSISISKLIKLRLGDTFRVVIYHNQRHIVQAQKVLAALES